MARPGKSIAKPSEGRAGEKYLPVGGRVRTLRTVGDSSGPSEGNIHEQAWKTIFGRSLRPCLGQGASQGEEAVLADSGWAGEMFAGVGRVRRLDFLNLLLCRALLSQTGGLLSFWLADIVFLRPASLARSEAELEKQKIPCQDADLVDFMQVIR